MSNPLLVLGVDPGPKAHGWAWVQVREGEALYLNSGNEAADDAWKWLGVARAGELVAIECPQHAYSAATASPIIATARAAGELGGAAKASGYRVEYITAADWRAGLLGAANAHDRAVKEWVERNVQGLPKKTNVHVRDAIALAVFAGRRALRGEVML